MNKHKYGDDCYYTHITKVVTLTVVDQYGKKSHDTLVCPCCRSHSQIDTKDPRTDISGKDCKNQFWDGYEWASKDDAMPGRRVMKVIGQCCCWSEVHAYRGD